jgi:hypothetical protein
MVRRKKWRRELRRKGWWRVEDRMRREGYEEW